MAYNVQQQLSRNIDAIRLALLHLQGQPMTADDVAILHGYAGFGGIKAVLYPVESTEQWQDASQEDLRLYPTIVQFHQLLEQSLPPAQYQDAVDSMRHSVLTAFYTPAFLPKAIFEQLQRHNISPKHFYEPSAGAGVFIQEALQAFPSIEKITAVEKDFLTGLVLKAIASTYPVPTQVHITGLEETPTDENAQYDLIVSNIPFGDFRVFDPSFSQKGVTDKIHNYFFAKGLDKLKEGGLLVYITSTGFLDSPSNREARSYVLQQADLISLHVLPDNLFKEEANTESASHLLLLQKNSSKATLTSQENLLLETIERSNEFGNYYINQLISLSEHDMVTADSVRPGKNQYGRASQVHWQSGPMTDIATPLLREMQVRLSHRLNDAALRSAQQHIVISLDTRSARLTLLPMPDKQLATATQQLGLFDAGPSIMLNRAMDYINERDRLTVQKDSARILGLVRTNDQPAHECVLLITARHNKSKQWLYKFYSNVAEVNFTDHWIKATDVGHRLKGLGDQLKAFDHDYSFEGDQSMEAAFNVKTRTQQFFNNAPSHYRPGTLGILNSQVGLLGPKQLNVFSFTPLPRQHQLDFYAAYIQLRDQYLELMQVELQGTMAPASQRNSLNATYEAFTRQYGSLNQPANKRLIQQDETFGYKLLTSLERKEGNDFVKADILTLSLLAPEEPFRTDSAVEALARCLNDLGVVDIPFIRQATQLPEQELMAQLRNRILLNPDTDEWETIDKYLAGNVVAKLETAVMVAEANPGNLEYQRSVEALRAIQPEPIPFELLDFNLGERWIPMDLYSAFATHLFQLDTTVHLFRSTDIFKVEVKGTNAKLTEEYAVKPKQGPPLHGNLLLEHALENTAPYFSYEVEQADGSKVRYPDTDAIQLSHQKIENVRGQFSTWLAELPAFQRDALVKLYNQTFNCYVLRTYDGNHLQFPGLDREGLGIEDLYTSQKDAVWRLLQNRGGIIDHEVGNGKTLIMVVGSWEMKRLGIVRKPAILALGANVSQIHDTYKKAYPHARVLAPTEEDYTPANRLRLFNEIKNNQWDCIVLTHEQFFKVPQSPAVMHEILTDELNNLSLDLKTLRDQGGTISKSLLKGLEKRKNNLEIRIKELLMDIDSHKDSDINFKELGIDHLFVDESHHFKNLTFTTRHDRVAGLGNQEGSQKALNMLFAIRSLQTQFNADLCATFLSGTTISNSLTEMYLLFKYLRPRELAKQKITNFDAWAAVFARKTTDFEFSVTNEIIAKERFRHFIKVPELVLFYNEITDYKTAADIQLDKPMLREQLVNLPPSEAQQAYMQKLVQFAKTGDGTLIGRGQLSQEEEKSRMLLATNFARKIATDLRLIDPSAEDHPNNKVNACARKISELYLATQEHKGTQLIFSDIGTPQPRAFNLYDALKTKLVEDFQIPANTISFIHDWPKKKRPELFKKVNRGEIRILLGSTPKLGTGTNVQKRIVALHHLDIPWKSTELEQRNGRGARKGNEYAKLFWDNQVLSFIYATEQTLDNYKFTLLKNKQTFISQIKNNSLQARTIDESSINEDAGLNFSEYIAILSGDTSLLQKTKVVKQLTALENLRTAHFRSLARTQFELDNQLKQEQTLIRQCTNLQRDQAQYQQQLRFDKEGSKANPLHIAAVNTADAEAIGHYLIDLCKRFQPENLKNEDRKIGTLYGFDCYISSNRSMFSTDKELTFINRFYCCHPEQDIRYTYNEGLLNMDHPKLAARYFLQAIDRVNTVLEQTHTRLQQIQKDIPLLRQLLEKPFEKDADILRLKAEAARLEHAINQKLKENQTNTTIPETVSTPTNGPPAVATSVQITAVQEAGKSLSKKSSTRQRVLPDNKTSIIKSTRP